MNELFQWIVNTLKDARFWTVVLPWQCAIRVRFGRHACVWEPGFHLRVPFFDDVKLVNTRLCVATVPSVTVMARDGKTVTVAANIGFRIVDPLAAILSMQQPENTLSAFGQAEFARLIGERPASPSSVGEIEAGVLVALQGFAGPGLRIDFVRVVEFAAVRTFRLLNDTWRPSTGHGETL